MSESPMSESQLREALCACGHTLYTRGLATGSSGNLSVRLTDGWLLTPTNSCLGELDPARLSKLDWQGRHLSGDAPSKEAFMHQAMYEERPTAGAIIHLHSTAATAVSCMDGLNESDCIPPLTPYFVMKIGRLPLIPYHRPGDSTLGDAIRRLSRRHCAVLLANHGPVVSGKNLQVACHAYEELEETAKLFVMLQSCRTRVLDSAQLAELKQSFRLDI